MSMNHELRTWSRVGSLIMCLLPIWASAISVTVTVERVAFCAQPVGILSAEVFGGEGPYTFDWAVLQGITFVSYCSDCGPMLENLPAGEYRVTVTDALLEQAVDQVDLISYDPGYFLDPNALGSIITWPYVAGGELPYISIFANYHYPVAGYDDLYVVADNAVQWPATNMDIGGGRWFFRPQTISDGTFTITVEYDGQQCVFDVPYTLPQPAAVPPEMSVLGVEGSCSNVATGRATIAISNTVCANYTYPGSETTPWPYSLWKDGPHFNAMGYPNGTPWFQPGVGPVSITENTTYFELEGLLPGTHNFFASPEGTTVTPFSSSGPYDCFSMVQVTIPNLGPTCGQLKGRVFVDNNLNCTSQFNEAGAPGVVLEVLPGPYYSSTGSTGTYGLVLPNGSYTVEAQSTVVEEHCSGAPLPFTITGAPAGTTVNHPMVSLVPFDGRVSLSSGPARPGFEYHVGMSVNNLTPSVSGAITLTLEFDAALDFLSATPAPSNVSGNTITWSQAQLTAFESRSFTFQFQVPPDVGLLGTELITTATLASVQADANADNNTYTLTRTVTGAYDPNDKLARTSTGSTEFWEPGADQWIDYTIRFQNTGTDTAFHVIITDTLPQGLDPATLQVAAASHPFTWELKGIGVLKFRFLGILLPDSNINEPRSHGFVGFRIKVRDGYMLDPGDEVVNIANIYFDFNPPVITDPCVVSVPVPNDQVLLDAQIFLGGVYDTGTGLMRDDLRAQGLLPTSEPYSALGYSFQGGGGGTVSPSVLAQSGPTAIVDWVVVELRSAATPTLVGASRAALLRRDGRVVDVDGVSPLAINAASSSYLVALRHRNHLPVLFDQDLFFQPAENEEATVVNFTEPSSPVYGTDARRPMGSVMALWPGDVDFNGTVKYTGANNDRDIVLIAVGGNTPTNVVNGVYSSADVNMDGDVKYTGTGNDRDVILQTIGGVAPTAVRVEQVP